MVPPVLLGVRCGLAGLARKGTAAPLPAGALALSPGRALAGSKSGQGKAQRRRSAAWMSARGRSAQMRAARAAAARAGGPLFARSFHGTPPHCGARGARVVEASPCGTQRWARSGLGDALPGKRAAARDPVGAAPPTTLSPVHTHACACASVFAQRQPFGAWRGL